jgi:DNA-binding LacI/PurR family transcriptional regulator
MTTLKDVAELAGVSTATASLALNGGKVNEETRQRVLIVARRLNYVPNRIGRMLNTGRSGTICLLFMTSTRHADIVHHTSLFYYLVEGVMEVARQAKYSLRLEVRSHEDPDLLAFFEHVVGDRSLDGIMIVPQFLTDYPFLGLLQARAFPYVMFRPARFGSDVNFVDIENATGGRMVADLLIKLGHRRIALINGPKTHVDAIERERGFLETLALAGIYDVVRRYGDFLIKSGFNAMKEILADGKPEAVFCANDYMAAGAIKLLSESGLRVPQDVSVIGYDNNDICLGTVPSLTTVDHRLEELGQCLGLGLLDLIEKRNTEVRKSIVPRLIERQSHSRRPVETRARVRTRAGSD